MCGIYINIRCMNVCELMNVTFTVKVLWEVAKTRKEIYIYSPFTTDRYFSPNRSKLWPAGGTRFTRFHGNSSNSQNIKKKAFKSPELAPFIFQYAPTDLLYYQGQKCIANLNTTFFCFVYCLLLSNAWSWCQHNNKGPILFSSWYLLHGFIPNNKLNLTDPANHSY